MKYLEAGSLILCCNRMHFEVNSAILAMEKKSTLNLYSKICSLQNGFNSYFWRAILLENQIC